MFILCLQLEWYLWTIYLKSKDSSAVLLLEGFENSNSTAKPLFDWRKEPRWESAQSHQIRPPLSVDESAVKDMLQHSLDVTIKFENIAPSLSTQSCDMC